MGDRCSVSITFRNCQDARLFGEAIGESAPFWATEGEEDGRFIVDVDECNYAWTDELKAACAAGIEFHGSHGTGDEYPSGRFVSVNKKFYLVPRTQYQEFYAVCQVQGTKVKVLRRDLRDLTDYAKAYERLKAKWAKLEKRHG